MKLWCNECSKLTDVEPDHTDNRSNDTFSCLKCGEQICCDECGSEWSELHECKEL